MLDALYICNNSCRWFMDSAKKLLNVPALNNARIHIGHTINTLPMNVNSNDEEMNAPDSSKPFS